MEVDLQRGFRSARRFGCILERFFFEGERLDRLALTRRQLGDAPGTRALVGVLLLHRTLPPDAVTGGMDAAFAVGSFDPDLVAVEARRTMLTATTPPAVAVPATASAAASIDRPAPSLTDYDQLLSGVIA